MQIKALSTGALQLSNSDQNVAVIYDDSAIDKLAEGNILVGSSVPNSKGISRQGEYEYGGITVVGVESKEKTNGKAEYFRISLDGVNCLAITDKPDELEKHELDLIDTVDILLVYGSDDTLKLNKQITRFAPGAVIAYGFGSEKEAEESTGLKVEKKGKSFKFSKNDFLSEDMGITLYFLEK
jgi:hypothetical protein